MTLLNWEVTPDRVLLFTDTLALTMERMPMSFLTKVALLPHLGVLIAGTGISQVVKEYQHKANENLIVEDVDHLASFTPDLLREAWERLALPGEATATVYIFGLSKATNQFTAHAFRSTSNFADEVLGIGMAVKPREGAEELMKSIQSVDDFVAIALAQQEADRARPRLERIGIGGDLWMYVLQRGPAGSVIYSAQKLRTLPHADRDWDLILANLPANEHHGPSRDLIAAELARN